MTSRDRRASQQPMVRWGRASCLQPPFAGSAIGHRRRRDRREAGHRDPQHLERHQPVPHAPAGACPGRQARRLGGGRVPRRDARGDAVGDLPEAHPDALPEPAGNGHRGDTPLLPLRRGGPAGRLRQDHAGALDGGGERRPARDLRAGRTDAHGTLARRVIGQWHRHVALLGRKARRDVGRSRVEHPRGRARRALPDSA